MKSLHFYTPDYSSTICRHAKCSLQIDPEPLLIKSSLIDGMRLLISGVVFLFLVRLDGAAIWSTQLNETGIKNLSAWQPTAFVLQVTSKPRNIKVKEPTRQPVTSKPKIIKGNPSNRQQPSSAAASMLQVISKIKSIKGNEPIESVFDDISEIVPASEVSYFASKVEHVHHQEESKTFCNPAAPPECVDKTFGFCINDIEYPEDDIKVAIELSELAQKFTYKRINDAIRLQLEYENKDSECPYRSLVIKPIRARNIDGQWRVIVQNAEDILQRERIVICYNLNDYCQTSTHLSPVHCYSSRCSQQYLVRKLLAYDPCNPDRGVFVDFFKLQSSCSCRFSRKPC